MKIDEIFELSYCINLDHRVDRWQQCQFEFDKIGFYPKRFSAIDNETPAYGCYLSHLAILKEAYRQNKSVLIFEDDVQFMFNDSIIEIALDELSKIDWDMFYLGGNILRPFYQVTNHLAKLTHCQSTHAYGVNKNFLEELIAFLEKTPFIVDVMYAEGVVPKRKCFIVVPMMAIQRKSFSDIENKTMDYSIPMERYNHFLIKKDEK